MAEMSFPYGSVDHDRRYKSSDFRAYYALFLGNGVFYNNANALKVIEGDGMTVMLNIGNAFIEGAGYRNTSVKAIKLDMADGARARIDRIVIRNDYKARDTYSAVLKGSYSAQPQAPALTRNADAYEIAVADILVKKGAVSITQADITDTRLNKGICGIVTGLVDQADTTEIFNQFEMYFDEFKAQTGISYAQFMEVMETYIENLKKEGYDLHNSFHEEISGYIANLKAKGDENLATLTQQLIDFRNTNETEFLEWFEKIKGVFSTDAAGELLLKTQDLNERIVEMENMLFTGMVKAELASSNGDNIIDSMGNTIMVRRPICQCTK